MSVPVAKIGVLDCDISLISFRYRFVLEVGVAGKASEWEETARLIEKAIRGLPDREQRIVVRYLLRGWLDLRFGQAQPPGALHRALEAAAPSTVQLAPMPGALAIVGVGREHQTLPVRLAEEQYARLKQWCAEQGFSMATVIRGLVERFLETQGRPKG
jgi:hypothetical protein